MKILTGFLKGRPIELKPHPELRPTADRVRKAIFDMLQGAFEGKRVLDLFSGTGALGFEALSSGAGEVVWVEADKDQAERIRKNLEALDLEGQGQVICGTALDSVRFLARGGESFDFVFMDAPYFTTLGQETLSAVAGSGLLPPGSFLVYESRKQEDPPDSIGRLKTVRTKYYGGTKITIYAAR